jgi:hypothetical protein
MPRRRTGTPGTGRPAPVYLIEVEAQPPVRTRGERVETAVISLRELLDARMPAETILTALENSQLPLILRLNGGYELHAFFRDFLTEKLLAMDGAERKQRLHAQLATLYEALGNWNRMAQPAKAGPSDWLAAVRATDAEDIRRLRADCLALQARLNEERAARTRIEERPSDLRRFLTRRTFWRRRILRVVRKHPERLRAP